MLVNNGLMLMNSSENAAITSFTAITPSTSSAVCHATRHFEGGVPEHGDLASCHVRASCTSPCQRVTAMGFGQGRPNRDDRTGSRTRRACVLRTTFVRAPEGGSAMATVPFVFRTQTTVMSAAPPEAVFDTITDLRAHLEWSGERAASETFKLLELDAPGGPALV